MRVPSSVADAVDAAHQLGRYVLLVRSVVGGAVVACWLVGSLIGGFDPVTTIVLLTAATAATLRPDSPAPLVLIVLMAGFWMVEVRPMSVGWSIVLACCVLLVHVSTSRAATLVEHSPYDRGVTRRWLAQTGVVAATTAVVWCVVLVLHDSPLPGGLLASAAAFVAVAATLLALRAVTVDR
ncbi:MAG TPA: hypothetical protein VH419_08760 [Nocardioidaceae bacterium]|jgi:hypothetical protein